MIFGLYNVYNKIEMIKNDNQTREKLQVLSQMHEKFCSLESGTYDTSYGKHSVISFISLTENKGKIRDSRGRMRPLVENTISSQLTEKIAQAH